MAKRGRIVVDCQPVELDGVRYVILRESVFRRLCDQAGVASGEAVGEGTEFTSGCGLDRMSLAEKLVRRRVAAGLAQAELARQAGIRPETLNRIERGRTSPDFATVRKLVVAMNAAETQCAAGAIRLPRKQGD